mmetsp:Transcript_64449/g.171916  ORF Transcript_64449/g.171916 Transcript_64449/m.171916 type:complete len:208 (-) Transcript_64449:67-690(-)
MLLTDVLDQDLQGSGARIVLLAVHVLGADVPEPLAGKPLKVRVKYGHPGSSTKCDTHKASAEPGGRLDFGTACCFLANRRMKQVVRLRLVRPGLFDRTVGKASLDITGSGQLASGLKRQKFSDEGFGIGWFNVHLEVHSLRKGDLRRLLQLLGARRQLGAFSLPLPVQGSCGEEAAEAEECDAVGNAVQGIAVSRGGVWGLRATFAA